MDSGSGWVAWPGPWSWSRPGSQIHVQSPSAPLHQSKALLPKIGPRPQVAMVGFSVPAELFWDAFLMAHESLRATVEIMNSWPWTVRGKARNAPPLLTLSLLCWPSPLSMRPIILKFSFILLNQQDLPGGTKEVEILFLYSNYSHQPNLIHPDKLLFQFIFHNSPLFK